MTTAPPQLQVAEGLEDFVRLLLSEPALQTRLAEAVSPNEFVVDSQAIAAGHGLPLAEATLRGALRPDPVGLGRFGPAPVTLDCWPGEGWLPARSVLTGGPPAFDWALFGTRQLTESFYEDSVRRTATSPLNLLLRTRTGLDALIAGAAGADTVPLTGLIFHMSRCGSTLLAQMLGAPTHHAVASEPEALDAILQWAQLPGVGEDHAIAAVQAFVAAMSRRRGSQAQRFFIKLDAWHILSLPLLRAALPDVPWVYLFRDPIEVLVSHRRQPGMHTVAGTMPEEIFGISDGCTLAPIEYAARTLKAIGEAAIEGLTQGGGMALSYTEIAASVPTSIARHFGFTPSAADRESMRLVANRDAKAPDRPFAADSQSKRAAADDTIRAAAASLDSVHAQLVAAAAGRG